MTSESTSFPNLDYQTVRDLGPGEAVYLRADSIEQLRAPQEHCQICSFLWVYYGFPTSTYEGRNVEEMRYDNGEMMAAEDDTDVDCVCGIPDSGVGMALGYAAGMRKPYQRAISKYTPTFTAFIHPAYAGFACTRGQNEAHSQPRYAQRQTRALFAMTRLCAARSCATT